MGSEMCIRDRLQMLRGLSVCELVTTVGSENTAEPIEMPSDQYRLVRPKEPYIRWLDGGRIPHGRGNVLEVAMRSAATITVVTC